METEQIRTILRRMHIEYSEQEITHEDLKATVRRMHIEYYGSEEEADRQVKLSLKRLEELG